MLRAGRRGSISIFLNIATGSAAEAGYLTEVSTRLGLSRPADGESGRRLVQRTGRQAERPDELARRRPPEQEPEPTAQSREPRAQSREPRAESREPRAESREPRARALEPSDLSQYAATASRSWSSRKYGAGPRRSTSPAGVDVDAPLAEKTRDVFRCRLLGSRGSRRAARQASAPRARPLTATVEPLELGLQKSDLMLADRSKRSGVSPCCSWKAKTRPPPDSAT